MKTVEFLYLKVKHLPWEKFLSQTKNSQQAPNIHPAVKKYLGKAPKSITQDETLTSQPSSVNQEDCLETKVKVTGHHGTEKIGTLSLESCSAKVACLLLFWY